MAYEIAGKNKMLDDLGVVAIYAGLLDGSDVEVTGGSPAYARKSITWGAAANGSKALSNSPVFDIPAGVTVSKIILCSALTGGTTYATYDATNETFAGQGTYTITSGSIDLNL
jgi:hypothetical protein